VINAPGELLGALGAPGPHLWRHVVNDRNPGSAQTFGDPQREAG
jgi:hypothetical protein